MLDYGLHAQNTDLNSLPIKNAIAREPLKSHPCKQPRRHPLLTQNSAALDKVAVCNELEERAACPPGRSRSQSSFSNALATQHAVSSNRLGEPVRLPSMPIQKPSSQVQATISLGLNLHACVYIYAMSVAESGAHSILSSAPWFLNGSRKSLVVCFDRVNPSQLACLVIANLTGSSNAEK